MTVLLYREEDRWEMTEVINVLYLRLYVLFEKKI